MSEQTTVATVNGPNEIKNALNEKPDAVLDFIANDLNVSLADVISCLPVDQVLTLDQDSFEPVMNGLSDLGPVTFIVHTKDIVLECKGTVPQGSFGRGHFNIHGDSPIGGHIKADNCKSIFFVSREMMGRMSHSIVFCNGDGDAMYKAYLARDEERNLIPEQVTAFETLKKTFSI